MVKPVGIRAALIVGGCAIFAALIAGSFQVLGSSRSPQTITAPDATYSPITTFSDTRDVTINNNYNVPDTATRDAIKLLEEKADAHDTSIQLTRDELLLLSKAFQDLDQRTSGIQKLPDGRTLFGHVISGIPTIVLQEYRTAVRLFNAKDYKAALEHSQRSIKAYEDTKQMATGVRTGDLPPEMVGKLYALGATLAQKLGNNELAHEYAMKAAETRPESYPYKALLATTLVNIGKGDEAMATINKATEADPNNKEYQRVKAEISKRVARSQLIR